MNLKFLISIAVLLFVGMAPSAFATAPGEWMTVRQQVSDRETRFAARDLAIHEMKIRAAAKAGTIVEATTVSTGASLTEEIKTIGVSLVTVSDVTDSLTVEQDGTLWQTVKALVSVDESELQRRVEAMRLDVTKIDKIRALINENEILRISLDEVAQNLKRGAFQDGKHQLIERYQELTSKVQANNRLVGITFTPGTLGVLSAIDESNWVALQRLIDHDVFDVVMNSIVRVSISGVRAVGKSEVVTVSTFWSVDGQSIDNTLKPYLVGTEYSRVHGNLMINAGWGRNIKANKSIFTRRLFDYLVNHSILLEIEINGEVERIPVMFYGNGFMQEDRCENQSINYSETFKVSHGSFCLVSSKAGGRSIELAVNKQKADRASQIQARWVLQGQNGAIRSRGAILFPG